MKEPKGHDFTWTKPDIEFYASNSVGVNRLRDNEGKVLFVGKGNVRKRLLSC